MDKWDRRVSVEDILVVSVAIEACIRLHSIVHSEIGIDERVLGDDKRIANNHDHLITHDVFAVPPEHGVSERFVKHSVHVLALAQTQVVYHDGRVVVVLAVEVDAQRAFFDGATVEHLFDGVVRWLAGQLDYLAVRFEESVVRLHLSNSVRQVLKPFF